MITLYDRKRLKKRQKLIYKENEKLIKYWRSIPWWLFWKKPSFETQRNIILENWSKLK